ncbi:hypothetical protein M406DRAFT_327999 [Cryphonectria parasitica EP155]|uniref:N-acetyltransferase domain-containing protein n=1 Tax=Cryphonectria parasitica (strain ATCC 38755 / EP155) TaxID=660469 RepID=A0A9P4Y4N6_CRYP1|nr:uncharacterized protein M406DRAFT_327999 [Cryphonectria parasitica EP155]KAF3766884.1 hypothetical protein M406DRAFT_327999 [Cryphonectria parasitica EP155]
MLGVPIEKATAADAKAVADIYQDRPTNNFNRLSHGNVSPSVFNAGLEAMFAESLQDPNELLLVYRDESHPERKVETIAARAKYEARVMPGMNGPLLVEMWEKLDRMAEKIMAGRGPYWMVDNVGTLQSHQRRGIASALIRASFEECTGLPIYLDTSGDEDARAWRLYERLGFQIVAEFEIDLVKHGGEGAHKHFGMLREPRVATGRPWLS